MLDVASARGNDGDQAVGYCARVVSFRSRRSHLVRKAMTDLSFRDRIRTALGEALQTHSDVLAAWEGGSASFDAIDEYSDLDLFALVEDEASATDVYAMAEAAMA